MTHILNWGQRMVSGGQKLLGLGPNHGVNLPRLRNTNHHDQIFVAYLYMITVDIIPANLSDNDDYYWDIYVNQSIYI